MKIFLIGLPGSGKTTLGKQLAEKMKLAFIDLDSEIEKAEKQTIAEIFEHKKEDYFRKIESRVLAGFCSSSQNFVMSTGGGAPCFHDNIALMNKSGKTIFLDVPSQEIADRLKKTNLSERPLFAKTNETELRERAEVLRRQRIIFYRQARYIFNGTSINPEEVMLRIKG